MFDLALSNCHALDDKHPPPYPQKQAIENKVCNFCPPMLNIAFVKVCAYFVFCAFMARPVYENPNSVAEPKIALI